MSPEPGNLLVMARLNFRVKCNNQFQGLRTPEMLPAFYERTFFYGIAPVHKNYTD